MIKYGEKYKRNADQFMVYSPQYYYSYNKYV